MDYADRLRSLPRADLEELLARRPETAALSSRRHVDYDDLAALLAQTQGVRTAIASLDRFHRQVLELACVAGGRLDPEFAALQGLAPGLLPRVAGELSRWGLGFLDSRDLWLPPAVLAAVDDPGRIGPAASSLLALVSLDDQYTIATTLEVELTGARSEARILSRIAERLGDYAAVREMAAAAPPTAARVLEALRAAGGSSSWVDLVRAVPAVHAERGLWYAALRPAVDGIAWLRARGLAVWVDWERRLVVPAEVELALRGRVFDAWEPEPPALDVVPLEPDRHPVELVIEVDALLDFWDGQQVGLLQSGELGVRESRRAAAALGVPEEAARFLASLAVTAGLVAVEQPPPVRRARARGRPARRPQAEPQPGRLVVVDEAAGRWRALDAVERWAALVAPWRRLASQPAEPLRLVLDELVALPEGRGAVASSLARRLAWRHPTAFASVEDTFPVLGSALATLHRLGAGSGPTGPVAGVTGLGRAALRGATAAELAPLFPAVETRCTVQADLQVIVAGPPDPALARDLAKMADLEAASPARVYRLSEASLRRALDAGLTAGDVAGLLTARCPTGIPQNVGALIEDVARRHGRLRVGRASLYLQADDPALIAEVAVNRRLRGLRVTVLAPTVAVVEGADEAQALEALRRAGYMPRLDGALSRVEAPKSASPARRPAPEPPSPPVRVPDEADRRRLADRLLTAVPAVVAGRDDEALLSGARVAGRDDVERLLRLAIREGRAVEIEYRNQQSGSVSRRVIEPRLAGDTTVVGWCRLRQDDRAFAFDGVRWARAVGAVTERAGP